VAKAALEIYGSLEAAVDALSLDSHREQIELVAMESNADDFQPSHSKSALADVLRSTNVMLMILNRLKTSISHLNSRCFVCDRLLPFSSIKPSVCDDEFCSFRYEEIGVGFDLDMEVLIRPEVTDLLISLCYLSAANGKLYLSFPKNVRELGSKTPAFADDRRYAGIIRVLDSCPSLADMQKLAKEGVLLETLKKIDPLLFPLLKWIITSNRSHLRLLAKEDFIPQLGSKFQFILLSSSPAKELMFQQTKKSIASSSGKAPSVFAFHGSPIGNWHSILRMGLKNMSHTPEMMHGAAFGKGIYLALDSGTSVLYSARSGSGGFWRNSMFESGFTCLAVCEVLNTPSLPEPKPYYVIPNESIVCTRFFCIYPSSTIAPSVASSSLTFPSLLKKTRVEERKL
jgi:hypothetical protein